MFSARVIPCLLLLNGGLVKTIRFKNPKYVGDPINAVKIFNDKEVDELVLLDIGVTKSKQNPDFRHLANVAAEAFMPMGYGGGLRSIQDIKTLFSLGFEKAILNTIVAESPSLVTEAAQCFGSQSVCVSIDVRKKCFGQYEVVTECGRNSTGMQPSDYAERVQKLGAGEIILNSLDRDGTMTGYDLDLIRKVSTAVDIPVVAVGGAGSVADLVRAVREGGASAVSAGSLFVFHGKHRAVLITYPDRREIDQAFLYRAES